MEQLCPPLHTALAPVLKNRPEHPLLHLMSHFRELAGLPGSSGVSSAYRIFRLCPPNSPHCEGNIAQAFSILGAGSSGHVTAEQFLQLMGLLVDPLPDDLKQQMVQLFDQLGRLAPDFATFRAATKSCLLLEQLSIYTANRSPSDQMFQEAEARKLLAHLLQEQGWFQALQPLPESSSGVVCLTEPQLGSQQQHDAAAREASRLVDLALAAVRSSEDGT